MSVQEAHLGYDPAYFEAVDGPKRKVLRKRDLRTDAQKARAKFWDKRREETGDDRCGRGIFGDDVGRYWKSPLCELTDTKTGDMSHVRLVRYWPDDGVADLAQVAVMAGRETSGIGLLAKHPWPPGAHVKVRVIADRLG
jgi:hypothetical protein